MNKKYLFLLLPLTLSLTACEETVEGINDSPISLGTENIDAGLYLNSPELDLVVINRGLMPRVTALWSGQLIGFNQTPLQHYIYNVTGDTFSFSGYHDVILQCQFIQQHKPDNGFYQGVTRILEAFLYGTYASLYGDVPCSEAVSSVEFPKFDSQKSVFAHAQQLLDEAITYLQNESHPNYIQDYLLNGNVTRWTETAFTLKARFYTLTKEYDKAYAAAQKGISKEANSLRFIPVDDAQTQNKNYFYQNYLTLQGFGTSDLEGKQSFLFDLLDSRNNAKTDETARKAYYFTDPTISSAQKGFVSSLEPEPLVTYSENLLILAETGARTQGFETGLKHLNQQRAYLDGGGCANAAFAATPHKYEPLEATDFAAGGLLNADGKLSADRALLHEIIEERYVTGFCTFTPFDDARRLRGAKETDIAVAIPLNTGAVSQHPERLLYPQEELIANPNAPADPGLYAPTEVNR